MMEVEGARRLWTRSVAQHKLRYMTMLSDGDCKTFNELQNERPYGDVLIKKEECVNHVQKNGYSSKKLDHRQQEARCYAGWSR